MLIACTCSQASRRGATRPRTGESKACSEANTAWPLASSGLLCGLLSPWLADGSHSASGRSRARRRGTALSLGSTPVAINNWLASPYNGSASCST
ncbi:hypothetical protein D3C79_857920 [compost metagenome]